MKYTALTLGPIVKTLMLAHRTKELWAASYFFSYLMEKIIENISDKNSIILPYPNKKALIAQSDINADKINMAGIFPDRIILQSTDGKYEDLKVAATNALESINFDFNIQSNLTALRNYVYTHIIEFEFEPRSGKDDDNIIFQASDYLANCELQANYTANDDEVMIKMLENIDASKVYQAIFGKHKNFPSIIEIATRGLELEPSYYNQGKDEEDADIWNRIVDQGKDEKKRIEMIEDKEKRIQELEKCKVYGKLKTAHKYIAIVQADGDNIGEIIKQVAKDEDHTGILKFSESLSKFSLLAAAEIAKYGGTPVYVGGDDLLFFAPVVMSNKPALTQTADKGDKHIFNLLADIDKVFKKEVLEKYDKVKPQPSMSYGVSISYYKYPMHEALEAARNLLFEKAKEMPKNAIAFRVQKHSGQQFEAVLSKPNFEETKKDDAFSKLLKANNKLALHSVIYNMENHKTILQEIIGNKVRLNNFFENFYNEKVHDDTRDFFDTISELLTDAYTKSNDFEKTKNQVYAQLRLVQFLNSKNDE